MKAKSPRWRFNLSLLSNQTFITSLKEYIKEFLEINMPSDVDPQILWETTKCAIRGFCISFSSTLAKAKTHQFTQLENKIQLLQNLQKQHFTEQPATQLSSLKEEYDLLSHCPFMRRHNWWWLRRDMIVKRFGCMAIHNKSAI